MLKIFNKLLKHNKKCNTIYHELECPKCFNKHLSMSPYDEDKIYPINIEKHLYHCNQCGMIFYYNGGENNE